MSSESVSNINTEPSSSLRGRSGERTQTVVNSPTFPPLPLEITIQIVTHAAKASPLFAHALLRVSHWTRTIAINVVYSVCVLQIIDPDTAALRYTDGRELQYHFLKRLINVEPNRLSLSNLGVSEQTGLTARTSGSATAPGVRPQLHPSLVGLCTPLHTNFPHSVWIEGEFGWEWENGNYAGSELTTFFDALARRGSLRRVAVEPLAFAYYFLKHHPALFHNIAGTAVNGITDIKFADANEYNRYFGLPSLRKTEAMSFIRDRLGSLPLVTRLEMGVVVAPIAVLDVAEYAQYILGALPNVTHLAFTLSLVGAEAVRLAMLLSAKALIRVFLAHRSIRLLVLVVRDKEELANIDGFHSSYFDHDDEAGLEQVARTLVEEFNTLRFTYAVPPPDVPEWAFWEQCCRNGRDIWDLALEQRQARLDGF